MSSCDFTFDKDSTSVTAVKTSKNVVLLKAIDRFNKPHYIVVMTLDPYLSLTVLKKTFLSALFLYNVLKARVRRWQ